MWTFPHYALVAHRRGLRFFFPAAWDVIQREQTVERDILSLLCMKNRAFTSCEVQQFLDRTEAALLEKNQQRQHGAVDSSVLLARLPDLLRIWGYEEQESVSDDLYFVHPNDVSRQVLRIPTAWSGFLDGEKAESVYTLLRQICFVSKLNCNPSTLLHYLTAIAQV